MATKSFIEILEEQIRTDLRREIEAEVRSELQNELRRETLGQEKTQSHSAPCHSEPVMPTEWLLHSLGKTFFGSLATAQKTYQKAYQAKATTQAAHQEIHHAPRAKATAPGQLQSLNSEAQRYSPKTLEEICALELIRRTSSVSIGDSYTEGELKTAWRKAARKTHPDLFAQADQVTQMRMSVLFRELAEAFEHLQAAFETPAPKPQAAA
jgi:hypothetical protein